jgi:uncharacterized membrane protein
MTTPQPTPEQPQPHAQPGVQLPSWSQQSNQWWDEHVYTLDGIGPRRRAFNRAMVNGLNHADVWLRAHWLDAVNIGLGLFIGIAVAAPILRTFGVVGPSQSILAAYHLFCAQTPSHSFYIDGHQVCLCQRCLAIYSSLLLGGLVLSILQRRGFQMESIGWRWWVVAALPMALDGGTQLFGWRESDVWLRLFTGGLFGLATALFALPQIHDAAQPPAPAPAYPTWPQTPGVPPAQ